MLQRLTRLLVRTSAEMRGMSGMGNRPRKRRRGGRWWRTVQRRRRQFPARQRANEATVINPAMRGRWQRRRWRPVMMRHLLVRRAAGLRGQRYRRGDGRLGGTADRRTGHDAGIRLAVNVWRRRAADFRLGAGWRRRGVMRRRRRRGRGRMRIRIRRFSRAVWQTG